MTTIEIAAVRPYRRSARRRRDIGSFASGEEIAEAADRLENPWMPAVIAELRAEARDVDVDRTIEAEIGRALREIEQLLARQHLARALCEGAQDRELVGRDLDRVAV